MKHRRLNLHDLGLLVHLFEELLEVLLPVDFKLHLGVAGIHDLIQRLTHRKIHFSIADGAGLHVRVQMQLAFRAHLHIILYVQLHKLVLDQIVIGAVCIV